MAQPARALHAVPTTWEAPLPLTTSATLPAFPVSALPPWLADQVEAVAEAIQTPTDLPGCLALAALSTAAGGRAEVTVRRGWAEPVNLYTVVVMEPSARKSPVFKAMIAPIYDLEAQLQQESKEAIQTARVSLHAAEGVAEKAQKAAANAVGDATTDDDARGRALADAVEAALSAEEITVPVEPRLVADDATVQQVATILAQQGGRLAVLSDEGTIFENVAGRYSGAPNAEVFLKGYTGTQLRVDRGDRHEHVPTPALTLGLTIQPTVIDELPEKLRGNGFLARILYARPIPLSGHRRARPDPIPDAITKEYNTQLHAIAHTLHGFDTPAELVFTPAADDLMAEIQDEIEPKLDPAGGVWRHMADWAGKLHGQTARIAALLHIAEHPHNPWTTHITADIVANAWVLGRYFASHALHTFEQMGRDTNLETAAKLLAWITATRPDSFTKKQIYDGVRGGLITRANDVDVGLEILDELGHIALDSPPERPPGTRGRKPSPTFWTHPMYRNTTT
ncbi:DNA primase [Amycolatopsis sp. WAC 01376]|uniref:YfjI family protein n=1 Tax=Amycolatopsis sp. WAC 01376 TaxID=2203195 RepID=UPI000F788E9E|nr:YfjI family protein [Amycolatopsis sp. WAC 01376]RSM58939.1 DNA primase [Amycolatopsis sp. WAC 01376]